ncbi:MAG: ATP synthase subunit b [Phycisphaerae bacterium]|nr:ATP synthase subunit b [Phycisphaerae bacterium]
MCKNVYESPVVGPRRREGATDKAEERVDTRARIVERRERRQSPPQPADARRGFHTRSKANRAWRGWAAAIAIVAALALAAPLQAAEGEGGGGGIISGSFWNAVWALVIFLGLLVVLGKFAWGPIVKQLEQREQKVHDTIQQAEQQRDDAMKLLAQYQEKLDQAREEAQQLMQKTVADAEHVKDKIVEEAREEAANARDRAVQQIEQAKDDALAGLFNQAATMATDVAGHILARELRPEDHARLVEQTLAQLDREQSRN